MGACNANLHAALVKVHSALLKVHLATPDSRYSTSLVSQDEVDALDAIAKAHYKGELWGLATHPHKHYFVTCGDDKRVRLWDANLRRQLKTRKLPLRARAAAVSPDGMRIAVALFDGKVCVLDGELKFIKYVKVRWSIAFVAPSALPPIPLC